MNFPRFGDLRKRIFHINPRPREGTAENRGRVLSFPEQQHSVLSHGGLAGTGLGERALPGIIAGIHYPMPAHKHPAYIDRFPANLPVTEAGNGNGNGHRGIVPMAELEKQTILKAIAELNGDKLQAARLLGIGKTTLYRKLKDYAAQL